jgi:hypothetical protein
MTTLDTTLALGDQTCFNAVLCNNANWLVEARNLDTQVLL